MMQATKTLKELCRKVRLSVIHGSRTPLDKQDDWQRQAYGYWCTLRYKGRQYSFDFWMGPALCREPDAEGVMECLLSDASVSDDFEDFCSEFGYDSDSRKAEATHKACMKTAKAMRRLLGDDFETFLYADRN